MSIIIALEVDTHTCTPTHAYAHAYTHAHTHTHTHTHTHKCTHVHTHIHKLSSPQTKAVSKPAAYIFIFTYMLYVCNRVTAWIGYYQFLPDIVEYFPYNFKIHELVGGKNVWK